MVGLYIQLWSSDAGRILVILNSRKGGPNLLTVTIIVSDAVIHACLYRTSAQT